MHNSHAIGRLREVLKYLGIEVDDALELSASRGRSLAIERLLRTNLKV